MFFKRLILFAFLLISSHQTLIAQSSNSSNSNSEIMSKSRLNSLFTKAEEAFESLSAEINHATPRELFCDASLISNELTNFTLIEFGSDNYFENNSEAHQNISFNITPQPSFNKKFDLLIDELNDYHNRGYSNYLSNKFSRRSENGIWKSTVPTPSDNCSSK